MYSDIKGGIQAKDPESNIWAQEEWKRRVEKAPQLHNSYRSPNIARVIKSTRIRLAGHVARMDEGKSAINNLTGKRL